ncbi:MAG TPA: hypothetical protein VHA75_06715 [Rugosimonospora sp.]|nr:hypothetical protein [Rugosimonospora sp.]
MPRTASRCLAAVLLAAATAAGAAGCGFIGAGKVSDTKPNGFVLRGHVSTPLPAGDTRPDGAACTAPASLPDIAAGSPVRVLDEHNAVIGLGGLNPGVVAHPSTGADCEFGFQIAAVPGGVSTYAIVVGTQPAHTFPAAELREDKPAVISLTG